MTNQFQWVGQIKMLVRKICDDATGKVVLEYHVDNMYFRCYAEPLKDTFTEKVQKILPLVGEEVWAHCEDIDHIRWMPMRPLADVASVLRGTVSYVNAPEFFDSFFQTDMEISEQDQRDLDRERMIGDV